MDFYKHEDYSEADQLNVTEIQVLQMLKDGNYEVEPYIYAGGVTPYGEGDPGFNKITLCYSEDEDCTDNKPLVGVRISVGDGDVVLEYDPSLEEWTSDDLDGAYGALKEPFIEWIDEEFDVEEYQTDEVAVATAVSESAFDLLPDYPCYEVDDELYYYIDPAEVDGEVDEEEQNAIDEMLSRGTELKIEEAARMLIDGDYEFIDIDDIEEEECDELDEVTKEDVLDCICEADKPMTAREIAKLLNANVRLVNQILYYELTDRVNRSETSVPYWSMKPLEEQVIACLSDESTTAQEIAEQLNVEKSVVNSVLYKLHGSVAEHDDATRPKWYRIEDKI